MICRVTSNQRQSPLVCSRFLSRSDRATFSKTPVPQRVLRGPPMNDCTRDGGNGGHGNDHNAASPIVARMTHQTRPSACQNQAQSVTPQ